MIITPLTELDAINEILCASGEDDIVSLKEIAGGVNTTIAQKLLHGISREIQQEGWDFNTFPTITFLPDSNTGKIRWDDTILRLTDNKNIRNRGGYFYDVSNDTDVFTDSQELTNVVRLLPFEELPDVFRRYITIKASLASTVRYLGDGETEQALNMELQKAYADVMTYELDTGKSNIFQNTSVAEMGTR